MFSFDYSTSDKLNNLRENLSYWLKEKGLKNQYIVKVKTFSDKMSYSSPQAWIGLPIYEGYTRFAIRPGQNTVSATKLLDYNLRIIFASDELPLWVDVHKANKRSCFNRRKDQLAILPWMPLCCIPSRGYPHSNASVSLLPCPHIHCSKGKSLKLSINIQTYNNIVSVLWYWLWFRVWGSG